MRPTSTIGRTHARGRIRFKQDEVLGLRLDAELANAVEFLKVSVHL